MSGDCCYSVSLEPISFLCQSEMVDADHVHGLATIIGEMGTWTTPIPIDHGTGIVMDGNHRLHAAAVLGLCYVPCIVLDYLDPRISVTHWRTGAPFCVASIRRRILQDRRLFPYKTTRHSFAPTLPRTDIPLRVLQGS
ncbi:ParB N-terminal domain-containing protein [Trinickia soli]|uniref:Transcriptional regulator n=1 Tax=Trinickia soli TaxID=380675 RepID=A0A2N7W3Y4_9BURK|nr:ParB N-terminal domain-containing protein [Trinickia soli]KAA0089270.1 transcriptional regulator [Paraburkholderia sp. T12-10]PMS24116.1 transcriptional regulator [Trinickia soli]CAB3703051.1 hypothetical protein LMG24076_03532 [Trinickia soli]